MKALKTQLIVHKDDYEIMMNYIKKGLGRNAFNRHDIEQLETELKKATVVNKDELPRDVVRLNSTVTIHDEKAAKQIEVTLVTPEKADIKHKKISIMSPIGTALIGFRKGQKVSWEVPAGKKRFTILEVTNAIK